jgi:hypothetical protein
MAALKEQGKTAFVKEVLAKNKQANHKAVVDAWKAAGRDGSISETLVNKLRSELGLTGNLRARRKPAEKNGAASQASSARTRVAEPKRPGRPAPSKTNGVHIPASVSQETKTSSKGAERTRVLTKLEGDIDEMIFEVKGAGGLPAFEETLRKARRILARSHQE